MPTFGTYWSGLSDGVLSDAGKVGITDTSGGYTSTNVDGALDEIADGTALDGRYVSALFVPAQSFSAISGSPTFSTAAPAGRKAGWLLDPTASTERLDATIFIPAGWSSVTATVVWANVGATGSGDAARFSVSIGALVVGQDANSSPGSYTTGAQDAGVTSTAAGQWITVHETSSALSVNDAEPQTVWVERYGSNASDTLANDAVFYGLIIRPV